MGKFRSSRDRNWTRKWKHNLANAEEENNHFYNIEKPTNKPYINCATEVTVASLPKNLRFGSTKEIQEQQEDHQVERYRGVIIMQHQDIKKKKTKQHKAYNVPSYAAPPSNSSRKETKKFYTNLNT